MINKGAYKVFSAVGAPAHETAHAIAALLCGFRIININIFKHVEFMVPSNLRGIIGSFFVSIAPALFNIIIFTIVCSKSDNIYLSKQNRKIVNLINKNKIFINIYYIQNWLLSIFYRFREKINNYKKI